MAVSLCLFFWSEGVRLAKLIRKAAKKFSFCALFVMSSSGLDRIAVLQPADTTLRFLRGLLAEERVEILVESRTDWLMKSVEGWRPDLVVLELGPDTDEGLVLLKSVRAWGAQMPVLVVADTKDPEVTIEVMKLGAYDIMHVPFDASQGRFIVRDALNTVRSIKSFRAGVNPSTSFVPETIVGSTPVMQAIFKLIGQVAPTNATVLITGESGVGKELIARAIYRHSLRKGQPFMAVNCAAIPENLLESELFGHEKGSFTGAAGTRKGKFEYCDEGTIFLDEVGDLPLGTQAKLLRVLQDGEFTRVGSNVPIRVSVRVIAATNKDLEAEISGKRFREDLFYRLNVVRIEVPSLRERKEDVPAISLAILKKIVAQEDLGVVSISQEAMQIFQGYSWPGNVRELENCIHRAAVLASGDAILPHHLPQSILSAGRGHAKSARRGSGLDEAMDIILRYSAEHTDRPVLDLVEHELLLRVLRETNGNQVQASRRLGMARATLRKRIEQLGLHREFGRG